jgi:hypothetical protein
LTLLFLRRVRNLKERARNPREPRSLPPVSRPSSIVLGAGRVLDLSRSLSNTRRRRSIFDDFRVAEQDALEVIVGYAKEEGR